MLSESYSASTSADVILAFWHLFAFCWSVQFISAIGIMTVAGTIGKWYFSKGKDEKISSFTVAQAFLCTVTYHMAQQPMVRLLSGLHPIDTCDYDVCGAEIEQT